MCKKPTGNHNRIDKCMENLMWCLYLWLVVPTVACCCGHGKYPMTILIKSEYGKIIEIVSDKEIPRKRNFYRKDKQEYYFIPEAIKNGDVLKEEKA